MLTATQAAVLNNKIAGQLSAIGADLMPTSKHNTESHAWNYLIASKIESYGKKLKETTRKEAIKAGVMFDHEKTPREPGTNTAIYTGDVVTINCAVKMPSTTFDHKQFSASLLSAGLMSEEIENIFAASFKASRPAHTFTAELLIG
jgi:hypothetical protein